MYLKACTRNGHKKSGKLGDVEKKYGLAALKRT
jgi:hypothetical protein